MAKKFALNRGLGDILQEVSISYESGSVPRGAILSDIPVSLIRPNPMQPRKHFDESNLLELSNSIKKNGLLQPVLVYERDSNDYVLIAGERRLRAVKLAGLDIIKSMVIQISDNNLREFSLIENIQRQDLNPVELANCFRELIDEHGLTHGELAERIEKSRSQVTNTLRLLELCEYVQGKIIHGEISHGHGRVIVGLDPDDQVRICDLIISGRLSVQDTERLVRNYKQSGDDAVGFVKGASSFLVSEDKVDRLKCLLRGIDVRLTNKYDRLTLTFNSEEQVDRFIGFIDRFGS